MKTIFTNQAPAPLGHYSQAIAHNGLIYVAGQLPLTVQDPSSAKGSIEEQTELTLKNLEAILLAAGSDKNHVLKVTIFITDISLWAKANEVYGRFFGDHKPARSAVPVKELPRNCLIEIEAIAAQPILI